MQLTITPEFRWMERVHGGSLRWHIWVEDSDNEDKIYHTEVRRGVGLCVSSSGFVYRLRGLQPFIRLEFSSKVSFGSFRSMAVTGLCSQHKRGVMQVSVQPQNPRMPSKGSHALETVAAQVAPRTPMPRGSYAR